MNNLNSKINISEVKKKMLDKFCVFFAESGFKLYKKDYRFKKETNQSIIDFSFEFLDFYPSHIEYSFACFISLKDIRKIEKEYFLYYNEPLHPTWHFLIAEGEFIHDLLNKERKYKRAYKNEISNQENLETALEQTFRIVKQNALPKAYSLDNLSNFQDYIFSDPSVITARLSEHLFIQACLFAAYLRNEQCYRDLISYLETELNTLEANGQQFSNIRKIISKVDTFVDHKNVPTAN